MSPSKVCLLIIDPQKDFCEGGALPVTGANKDCERIASMIRKNGRDIDDIQITLDSHYSLSIFHPIWWINKNGDHPGPFTTISEESVLDGTWRAFDKSKQDWSTYYLKMLKSKNRYQLMVWPEHCIIGTPGQTIHTDLLDAVMNWEHKYYGIAPRITKGSNPFTEHYSAVKADVEDPKDPLTRLNENLIKVLKTYDTILIAGEALSHCLANTARDIVEEFNVDQIKKIALLEDATSNVASCEKLGEDFVNEMVGKGMQISKTTTFFK